MPLEKVDINQIEMDQPQSGLVPVDIEKIELDSPPPQGEPNIFQRLGGDILARSEQAAKIQAATRAGEQTKAEEIFQLAGTGAGMVGDVSGEVIKSALNAAGKIPTVRAAGEKIMGAVGSLPTFGGGTLAEKLPSDIKQLSQSYGGFAEANPRAARNIGAATNLALTVPPMVAMGERAISGGTQAAKGIGGLLSKTERMTSEQLREMGGELFKKADDLGGVIGQVNSRKILNNIKSSVAPRDSAAALVPSGDMADKFLRNVDDFIATNPQLTLTNLMNLDSALGDAAYSNVDAFGKLSQEGHKFLSAQHALRESIDDAVNSGAVMGGNAGVKAWQEGKKVWAAQVRLRDIERILQKSMDAEQPATSIKNGFKTLMNSKKFSQYNAAEKSAIEQAAKKGIVTDVLGVFGSRLGTIGTGVGVGIATGNPVAGVAAGVAAGAAGGTARAAARSLQLARAQKVADLIRSRVATTTKSPNIGSGLLKTGAALTAGGAPLAAAQSAGQYND